MTEYELKQLRLYRQHLTFLSDELTVLHDLNGIQTQFMVNIFHALKIRCKKEVSDALLRESCVKNWTIRGTVHVFAADDLPLFKNNAELYRKTADLPKWKQDWFDFLLQQVAHGVCEREDLKSACVSHNIPQDQLNDLFDSWGGGMRDLCERGFLNYVVQEKKAFVISPDFEPMETKSAQVEMARRYFLHYAPATIQDAAYYFGWTQTKVKEIMRSLPLEELEINGQNLYFLPPLESDVPDIPPVLFLAGFDPLLLGYQKKESIFLPQQYLRAIFNLAGIVMPAILVNGTVAGRWRKKGGKLTIELFDTSIEKKVLKEKAEETFADLKKIEFQ